jgi:hypothetical protein
MVRQTKPISCAGNSIIFLYEGSQLFMFSLCGWIGWWIAGSDASCLFCFGWEVLGSIGAGSWGQVRVGEFEDTLVMSEGILSGFT